MSDIGVIAIGRNEGERLRLCLRSVVDRGMRVVYVDSGSTDGSQELARSLGVEVVALDLSKPFSAARARNAGFERLSERASNLKYVQFVDGDCEIVAGWIEIASRILESRPDVAVVCGRRRERFPAASIYNRLADLEWDRPAGETERCGGDAMFRVDAFRDVGGFDPTVAAGEEPELCQRLRAKGWKVLRLADEMTLHDSAMLHFGQWWKRQVRSGYGALDVATRFGNNVFLGQVHSARRWTVRYGAICLIAALLLTSAMVGSVQAPARSGLRFAAIALLLLPLAQIQRLALQVRHRTRSSGDAFAYGFFTVLGKWAHVLGQWKYVRDRAAGRNTRLIEYKAAPWPATPISPQTSAAIRGGHS
jgi:cellulose synthase/poly-beta-1,6-N-acetylglucosamine synthase-like glycosyltransferase